jgi:peptidoglycan hydrolase CwlO-like protein
MSFTTWKKIFASFFAFLLIAVFIKFNSAIAQTATPTPTTSSSSSSGVSECKNQNLNNSECVKYLESKVSEKKDQQKSLASQISGMDNQIKLTEFRISATKEQITELTLDIDTANKKIDRLENSITKLTEVLIDRIVATYEVGSVQPFHVLLTSDNASNFFTRLNYLKVAQEHDKRLIYDTTQAKNDYANQKEIFEDKKREVEGLKTKLETFNKQLEGEKLSKQQLLEVTKNDEARYQRLLAEARAERAIVLGGGTETFLRNVSAGDSIGSIISGASGCSSGTHIHFSVYQGTSVRDPGDYLSSKGFSYSYSDGQYGYYGTINPHGSYPWPIEDPVTVNQGYGSHGFAQQFYPTGFHDGFDLVGGSLNVRAVREGKLYSGGYRCGSGNLTYAKVEHSDGLISWYLHIYPH